MILQRLLIIACSSWIMSPLAISAAQWRGLADHPAIIGYLIITGAQLPFLLFLNDALGASRAKRQVDQGPFKALLLSVALGQLLFIWSTLTQGALKVSVIEAGVLCVCSSAACLISYASSSRLLRYIATTPANDEGSIRYLLCFLGALPGLTVLSIFLFSPLSAAINIDGQAALFIAACLVLPNVMHLAATTALLRSKVFAEVATHSATGPMVVAPELLVGIAVLASLFVGSMAANGYRIAISSRDHQAWALLLLNLSVTALLIVQKARYFYAAQQRGSWIGVLAPATVTVMLSMNGNWAPAWLADIQAKTSAQTTLFFLISMSMIATLTRFRNYLTPTEKSAGRGFHKCG